MPKIKTNRATAKRFRVTGTGKIKRRRANLRHILTTKNRKRKRRIKRPALVDAANMGSIARLIPYKM
jgi:large subunit ribosomal protein L35